MAASACRRWTMSSSSLCLRCRLRLTVTVQALHLENGVQLKQSLWGRQIVHTKKPWKESRALKACSSGWWICLYLLHEQTGFLIDEQAWQTE